MNDRAFTSVAVAGLLTAASFAASGATAQSLPAPSTWVNERGSILTIQSVDPAGKIKGSFINKAPDTQCLNTTYDLSGQITGGRVAVATVFTECKSVAVWRGRLNGNTLPTRFELAYPSRQGRISIWRGRDRFTKQ